MENRIKFDLLIPNDILEINEAFIKNGYKLFIVGGAIRDALLGEQPKDYDLATDAKPDEIENIMNSNGFRTLPTGKAFGVINVFTEHDEYEIATFRSDGDYGDSRRPDSVQFTSIDNDVLRRDLTINALFYDIDTGEVVDLVGGTNDLKNGIIRTVGDPEDRFGEDRLRIIRVIRFAGRFGGTLEPNIDKTLIKDADLVGISAERIRDEFLKGIKTTKSVTHFLCLLDKYNLFDWIFKGLNVHRDFIEERDSILLLAHLLKNNDPQELSKTLNKLTYTSVEVKGITFLVKFKSFDNPEDVYMFKKQYIKSGLTPEQIKSFGDLVGINTSLLEAFINFNLTVSGIDAEKEMGVKSGPEMGMAIREMEIIKFKELL